MAYKHITNDSVITVGGKKQSIQEVIENLIYLPSRTIKEFFDTLNLKVPRETRIFVLREVLREPVIEKRRSRLSMADELAYRLSWFTEFGETQLENLLVFFHDPEINTDYYRTLWFELLDYLLEKEVSQSNIDKLYDQALINVKTNGKTLPEPKDFNRKLSRLFYDSYGRIDGLIIDKFRPVLYKASTLIEIRDIGEKYEVDVPRRLKKEQLKEIVIKGMLDRDIYTKEAADALESMNVTEIQRFALDNDIKASVELKKEEIIEYILQNAQETKDNYIAPETTNVYDKEFIDISDRSFEEIFGVEEVKANDTEVDLSLPLSDITSESVSPILSKEEKKPTKPSPAQFVGGTVNVDLTPVIKELKAINEKIVALTPKVDDLTPVLDDDLIIGEKENVTETLDEVYEEDEELYEEVDDDTPNETIFINAASFLGKKGEFNALRLTEASLDKERANNTRAQNKNVQKFYKKMPFIPDADGKLIFKEPKKKLPFEVRFIIWLSVAIVGLLVLFLIFALVCTFVPDLEAWTVENIPFLEAFINWLKGILGN
ncbi:MAG: hypothetical protein LBV58_05045 [Acholeplasmatales bacterium]|jgi:hypothetical protein|nr:hypothetical protein [Acholeplasmatales bacterium]